MKSNLRKIVFRSLVEVNHKAVTPSSNKISNLSPPKTLEKSESASNLSEYTISPPIKSANKMAKKAIRLNH